MTYKLTFAARAERDIDEFLAWLDDYSPITAEEYEDDLYDAIRRHLLPRPHTWAPFFLTGRPYRGYPLLEYHLLTHYHWAFRVGGRSG